MSAPFLSSRDKLAAAIAPRAFAPEYRMEIRINSGIPFGVACAQDEAFEVADRLLASGVVVTPDVYLAGLAEDDDLIQRVHYGCEGNEYVNVEAVLTALAAALATPTTEDR